MHLLQKYVKSREDVQKSLVELDKLEEKLRKEFFKSKSDPQVSLICREGRACNRIEFF